jgi:hypothetical protein
MYTVLVVKRNKEVRSHLPVALSCVCKGNQTLLEGCKKGLPLNWQLPRSKSHQKGMGLDEVQLRETFCTDMKEQKSKIVKLLVTRMSNSNYLKNWWNQCPGN